MLAKYWIANQLPDAFNQVSKPQFDTLSLGLPIHTDHIALDFNDLAFPLGFSWETVDLLEEHIVAHETWLHLISSLTSHVMR